MDKIQHLIIIIINDNNNNNSLKEIAISPAKWVFLGKTKNNVWTCGLMANHYTQIWRNRREEYPFMDLLGAAVNEVSLKEMERWKYSDFIGWVLAVTHWLHCFGQRVMFSSSCWGSKVLSSIAGDVRYIFSCWDQ